MVVLTRKPAEEWGLCIDDDSMQFTGIQPNTAAARHKALRSCVGKVLVEVDNHKVYFACDLQRLARGDSIKLHFIDLPQSAQEKAFNKQQQGPQPQLVEQRRKEVEGTQQRVPVTFAKAKES